jgi:Protein of unknown function (DUF4056)/OmpA family
VNRSRPKPIPDPVIALRSSMAGRTWVGNTLARAAFQDGDRVMSGIASGLAELDRISYELDREIGGAPARPLPYMRRGPLIFGPELMRGEPSLVLYGFGFDRATLARDHLRLVDRLARFLADRWKMGRPIASVTLVGHTDSVGAPAYNLQLGMKRAAMVRHALAEALDRHAPGLSSRIRLATGSRGASRPFSTAGTPVARARNRRVEVVFPAARGVGPIPPGGRGAVSAVSHESIPARILSPRTCCLLAPPVSPFTPAFANPAGLGPHSVGGGVVGLIYCNYGGFVDLGHARDMIDQTKSLYDQIVALGGKPGRVTTYQGSATIVARIAAAEWVNTAQSICYDDALAHEITSYWDTSPGGRNSSFSPEDLFSNVLGTGIAGEAIVTGGNFDAQATISLDKALAALGANAPSVTQSAFNAINHCWVEFKSMWSLRDPDYLRRRNFTSLPWLAPGFPIGPPRPFPYPSYSSVAKYYTFTTQTPAMTIPKASFASEILRIRADAQNRYGPAYDTGVCANP